MSACCWVTRRLLAISALSAEDRYFLLSKLFSSSKICLPVKVVRIFFLALPSADVQSRMSSTSESFLRLFFFPISFVAPNSLVIIWLSIPYLLKPPTYYIYSPLGMDKLRGASTILLTGFGSEIEVSWLLSCLRRISSMEWGVNLRRNKVAVVNDTFIISVIYLPFSRYMSQ